MKLKKQQLIRELEKLSKHMLNVSIMMQNNKHIDEHVHARSCELKSAATVARAWSIELKNVTAE